MNRHTEARIDARDAAMRTLNRITTGAAIGAVAGVGFFSVVSAATIPGSSSSNGFQASGGLGSATSGSGVVVSGGSR